MADPGVSLREKQVAQLAFYMRNPKCLDLSDPGCGKTPPVCVMQWWLWKEHGVGTAFVMPLSLLKKNRDEILRFTDFQPDEVTIVTGLKPLSPAQKKLANRLMEWDHSRSTYELFRSEKVTFKALREAGVANEDMTINEQMLHARTVLPYELANPGNTKVFLMGFDCYSTHWKALPKFVKACHVDEIHKGYKGDSSQRTQGFYESFQHQMEWFIGMTGTLVSGRLDSAYPAIRVIEPRYYPSYKGFYYYHAIEDPFTGKLSSWRNHDKLSAIFRKHAIRYTFESVYGKEAKVIIPEWVEMSEKQRELYDKFKDDAFIELEKFFLDGTEPGVGFIRARQIMEHPNVFPDLSDPDSHETIDIMKGARCGKEERLDLHFEDHQRTGKPVIVYAALKPQQYRILELARKYGLKAEVINGDVTAKKRGEIDLAFREGRLNCIVASPAVADVGFNWQFCGEQEVDHLIFASLDFLDTTVLQAYRRAMRGKRGSPLRITVLLYEDSLDNRITWIIYQKSLDAHKVDPTQPILKLFEHNTEDTDMKQAA
ncbi:hypothetical protein JYP52_01615 [Nitratireductor aquibiodomus]|uniref:helicase-related protein n=1 Tax=Nitratireductor aquibiodomus TaxID=204799 RepID=UPI0019D358F6|nr:helicase-related protein [Nitratireductor aquibiodomus]MBN7759821.1 hypothetical protein [Nitratireductor aquibiodomus]